MKRNVVVSGVILLAIGLIGAGWLAAVQFQSPAQRQADARPPSPGAILEPVRRGSLTDEISGSGQVSSRSSTSVTLTEVPERAVVTGTPTKDGAVLTEGDVLAEVNGRPVITLTGKFDFYRDIRMGDTGPDVLQLQNSLARLGLLAGAAATGEFEQSTAQAIERLYLRVGYPAPEGLRISEVVIVERLPAVIGSVAKIGSHPSVEQPIAVLSHGELVVQLSLSANAVMKVRPGMSAMVNVDGISRKFPAVVAEVREAKSADELSTVELKTRRVLAEDYEGRDAVARIRIDEVASDALLVPVRAIGRSSNRAFVLVADSEGSEGSLAKVEVRIVGELAGQAAIEAVEGKGISLGSLVKVG